MDAAAILLGIRRRLMINRVDLARLCGVSPSTVGRIEKQELDPRWGLLTQILESSGFMLHGERIVPTGEAAAAVAARLALDQVLDDGGGTIPGPTGTARRASLLALNGPAELQVWWDRWCRAGWLSDAPTSLRLTFLARQAGIVSRNARAAMPRLAVGDGHCWRDLALRIDEAGFDYAVSDFASVLECPAAGLSEIPRIYVSDPWTVASVLRLEESPAGRGIPLVSAGWPELDGVVAGDGICFTSTAQVIMDGLAGDEEDHEEAWRTLSVLLTFLPVV